MYNQEVKRQSRELLINNAIDALTVNRFDSFLVSKEKLDKITDHFKGLFFKILNSKHFDAMNQLNWLIHGEKTNWYNFYDSMCQSKDASALKVLYLSGPEPLNDIEMFLNKGISLANIWAIESDKNTYQQAVSALIEAELPVKIHRGTLTEFFELTNHQFDIIYYDACTPFISPTSSPFETLKQIFLNNRLTGLSALITNFAEPKTNLNWGETLACWYASATEFQSPPIDFKLGWDEITKSTSLKDYGDYINKHLHEYYDYFLTQFISCFASEIIPIWQVFALSSVQSNFFWQEQELFKLLSTIKSEAPPTETMKDFIAMVQHYKLAVSAYPLLNWTRLSEELLGSNHVVNTFLHSKRKKMALGDALYLGSLLKSFEEGNSGFNTFTREICSPRFRELLIELDFFDRHLHLTCDIPMKNLIVELFFGLYGFPYVANTEQCLSLKYKAKETWMFSNCFIFDQCRYLYDYIPSPDLFKTFFSEIHHQVILRGCIDLIHRKHLELNPNFFKWGFVEGIGEEFGAYHLRQRRNLNEEMNQEGKIT
ncbi:hypothetical protein [Flavisolibacter ginsenosidimutans]